MSKQRGRQVTDDDFSRFDLILAMDRDNLDGLMARCPEGYRERVRLLMEFARKHSLLEVPDPYYGNARGFELVLNMIEDACDRLLDHVGATYARAPDGDAPRGNVSP